MDSNMITAISTVILSIITTIYVVLTYKISNLTQKQMLSQILLALRNDYSSNEMLNSIHCLVDFKTRKGSNFDKQFISFRKNNYDMIRNVDQSRRKFKGYFLKLFYLLDLNLINDEFIKIICEPSSIGVYINIVEPLEKSLNDKYDKESFDYFRKLYDDEIKNGECEIISQ